MQIIFVITNINGTYNDAYSFGLASIASIARDRGFDYDYAVINSIRDYVSFFDFVESKKPHVIAYTSVSSQFMFIKDISEKIREKHGKKILQICGGIHATIFPECVLEADALDGIFVGEGEHAFSDFLDRVSSQRDYHNLNNFAYQDKGNLVKNPLYPLIACLDELPFPEREKYRYERFIKRDGCATFMFSRGCPYFCSYCSNHAIAKAYNMGVNKPRYRSPASCIEEIKELVRKYSIKKVFVGDDTFGLDKKWTKEFCSQYAKVIRLPLVCQLRVNIVNNELMEYLKIAKCVHVSCGIESGNAYIRNEIMKRNISEEQIVNAYALFKRYGMSSNAINIIGLPHETIDNIWDTIRLNRKINPNNSGINIFYPYRGTQLGDYCFEHGLVDQKSYINFSGERRSSVLNYSKEFKDELEYFYKNWHFLIYKYRIYRLIRPHLVKFLKNSFPNLWEVIRSFRRKHF